MSRRSNLFAGGLFALLSTGYVLYKLKLMEKVLLRRELLTVKVDFGESSSSNSNDDNVVPKGRVLTPFGYGIVDQFRPRLENGSILVRLENKTIGYLNPNDVLSNMTLSLFVHHMVWDNWPDLNSMDLI